jgi:CheY-like chemotaxis protein
MATLQVLEDEKKIAENFISQINPPKGVEVKFITEFSDMENVFNSIDIDSIVITDLNLKTNIEEREGIELIKELKSKFPNILIIVFTAYKNAQEACYKAGADYFFVKTGIKDIYLNNCNIIHDIIKRELFLINDIELKKCVCDLWLETTLIPAKVFDFNDDFVILNCMIDVEKQSFVEKKFPRSIIGDVSIGESIMVTIKDRPNRICYLFERDNSDKVSKYFLDKKFDDSDDIDDCLFV